MSKLLELQVAQQNVETAQQELKRAQSEVKFAEEEILRHKRAVKWYQWIDIIFNNLLNNLGDGWSISSDTSNPDICGALEMLPASYKGKVEFSLHGSPVRVWTPQLGVLYVEAVGFPWRRRNMIDYPYEISAFEEVNSYILEVNVDIATLLKLSPKKTKREKK